MQSRGKQAKQDAEFWNGIAQIGTADKWALRAVMLWRLYRRAWRVTDGAILARLRNWITIGDMPDPDDQAPDGLTDE